MSLATPPFPSRKTVLAAVDMLRALGHTGFERFLLELGLPDAAAGQGGSLMARSNSLAQYALSNPSARTAEGELLNAALVSKAGELYRENVHSNIGDREREAFQKAASADGVLGDVTSPNWPEDPAPPTVWDADLSTWRAIPPEPVLMNNKIFIVHGHDTAMRESVARFISRMGLEPIILAEQVNGGRTVIEKFERNADVGFAIILLSPDDNAHGSQGRARQNVILEWGYFIGRLGRGHVCALKNGDVELPSDIVGIVWQDFDVHGAWQHRLARELIEAGYQIDLNRL